MSFPVENTLFRPPPRITLKLKMPKVSLGNGKTSSKSGNGPLCPDNSGNVHEHSRGGLGQGKPQLHGHGRREALSNGLLSSSTYSRRGSSTTSSPTLPIKPTGKPLALHAALHGHSSNTNGKLDQDRVRVTKPNGLMEKFVAQKDISCQTPSEQDSSNEGLGKGSRSGSFRKSTMEHFSRSFKEATVSLVRTTEDLRVSDKLSRKGSGKDRPWAKPVSEQQPGSTQPYQESDGYCPDLELSDSEPEAKGKHQRQLKVPHPGGPGGDNRRGASRGKQSQGSRTSVQR